MDDDTESLRPSGMVPVVFEGGPGDGAVCLVEYDKDGQPPQTVVWLNGEVFASPSDQPAPPGLATYQLALGVSCAAVHWVYHHVGTRDG
ncbi:MAG TPA: hypothetical protein VJT31_09780 [Rugosimonospora sp.]|nr:hypothetical protein [Rugosimonospora sp.]